MSLRSPSTPAGFLVIDKPSGLTSREVLNRLQAILPRRTKIGHAGTLDPLATGVLVVAVGPATRLIEYVQAMGKTYQSRFRLGVRSPTDDADGEVEEVRGARMPTPEEILATARKFVGWLDQRPPAFSALKLAGERAYDLARRGLPVQLTPRPVRIDALDVLDYQPPDLDVRMACSKGTYVRSLARDLGDALGCGAIVQELRRTAIGPFRVEDASPLDVSPEDLMGRLRPMADALADLGRVILDEPSASRFLQGQRVGTDLTLPAAGDVVALGPRQQLLGIATVIRPGWIQPKIVLPPDR